MATVITASVSGVTLNLTNKSPYRLVKLVGGAGAPLHRVTNQGPAQDGDTDEGYRLDPRNMELTVGYIGTTDAITDGYRDTLRSFFKPLTATPIQLKATRDDGGVRQLDCYRVGKLQIGLVKEHRAGHYQEMTISLRAAQPAYYDPTPGTVTVTGAPGTAADWYLAGGAIGTARVLMSGGTPAQGAAWSYAGSIAHTTSWTVAMRAEKETFGTADKYMFYVDNNDGVSEFDITLRAGTAGYFTGDAISSIALGTAFMPAGTANYFVRHDISGLSMDSGGLPTSVKDAYNGSAIIFHPAFTRPIGGATRRWRSDAANSVASRWASPIHLYALYSPGLTYAEMSALDVYMAGGVGGTSNQTQSVPYQGDLPEYPVISITGPITNAIVYNISTSEQLNFFGVTIGAGTTYVIDTRPGAKTVLQGTTNKRADLADYSNLDTWHITPDAPDGYNPIVLYGSNTSGATQFRIVWYNRYSSY